MGHTRKDYSEVAPEVVQSYQRLRNMNKVCKAFGMSPYTVKHILDEADVSVGPNGTVNHHWKKRPLPDNCCAFCHKYSKVSPTSGYCLRHRRAVSARNVEHCFV